MRPRGEIRVSQAETDQSSGQRELRLPSRAMDEYMYILVPSQWLGHAPGKNDSGEATGRCYICIRPSSCEMKS